MCMNHSKTLYLPIMPKSADGIFHEGMIRVGVATTTASRCVQCLGSCTDRHHDMKKQVSQYISTCVTLIILSVFFPSRQRNALPMSLSYHCLTSVTQSYAAGLQLTSPVYSEYTNRLPR